MKSLAFGLVLVCLAISVFIINESFRSFTRTFEAGSPGDSALYNKPYKLPENVSFAGERMPLNNFDTRESLDREILTSAYRHSSTIMIIKRANRYLPVIEKILKANDIPDDFKYLVAAESEYSNMISPAGATGFWQIMPETGKEAGMEINNVVDERYHIEKSTQFACSFFRKSYEKYGNWTLAAASYNGGRAAIDEQISIQKENNYYDLLLAEETARYIFRAVAYKLVISDPQIYGFNLDKDDLYPELDYYEVKVDTAISDFSAFAKSYGTNYKMLKFLNPWLRKPYFTPKPTKEYLIKIPSEGMRSLENIETSN
ncbi:MAG TPA: murein transglycosylase [Bacteroidales bacterium]|nr:murein transglycosylase [Bacteroidales bacterium]HBZ21140.1 murein transglycosylase [Bacteroidales bacterium]